MSTIIGSREITLVPAISSTRYSSSYQLGEIQVLEIGLSELYLTELERITIVDTANQSSPMTLYFFDSLPTVNSVDNEPFSIDSSVLSEKLLASVTVDAGKYVSVSGVAVANATFGNVNLKSSPYSPGKLYCVIKTVGTPNYITDCLTLRLSFVQYRADGYTGAGGSGSVTNVELDKMAAYSLKGNNTNSAAKPLDLDTEEVTAMLNEFYGDLGQGGIKGLVPQPQIGDSSKFLSGSGTWKEVSKSLPVRAVSSSAIIAKTDYYIGVDSSSGSVTLALPNPSNLDNGQVFIVKDESGAAGLYPITINGNGADIDGQPTLILNAPRESVELIARLTFWCIK